MMLRQKPSGRDQKRLLNRATRCDLCRKPMTREDRRLFTGPYHMMLDGTTPPLVVAHPSCAEQRNAEESARMAASADRMTRAWDRMELRERAARSGLWLG